MSEEQELLPCPFCGTSHKLSVEESFDFYVECNYIHCQMTGPLGKTKEEAISQWNKRAK